MGVFSINESHFNIGALPEVEMNEDYKTGVDMAIALVESRENEFAVLQAGIKQDMMAAMCEDYDERLAINEATASGVLGKVKEILTKLLEKLKGIFHAFMTKINSFFMDSNKFFKTYSSEIAGKNLTDFKVKAREFHIDRFNGFIDKSTASFGKVVKGGGKSSTVSIWKNKTQEEINRAMDSDELGKEALKLVFDSNHLGKMSIDEDFGNLAKEVEDYLFEEAEEMDNLNGSKIVTDDWIGGLLSKKNFISDIEKTNQATENKLKKMIAELGKDISGIASTVGTNKTYKTRAHSITFKDDQDYKRDGSKTTYTSDDSLGYNITDSTQKDAKEAILKYVAYEQALATKLQDCMIKAQNARLACAKKAVAQAKKIFAAAVAYNPKKEDYELYTAVGESAEFEAMMAME